MTPAILLFTSLLHAATDTAAQDRYLEALFASVRSSPPVQSPRATGPDQAEITGPSVPGGIYQTRSLLFIRGGKLERIVLAARAYNDHKEQYHAVLHDSALCSNQGETKYVFRYWTTPYFDTVVENTADYTHVSPTRVTIASRSSGVGAPPSANTPLCQAPLTGNRYVRRIHTVWQFVAVDEGVVIQVDGAAAITTNPVFRPFVKSTLSGITKTVLEQLRLCFESPPADSGRCR